LNVAFKVVSNHRNTSSTKSNFIQIMSLEAAPSNVKNNPLSSNEPGLVQIPAQLLQSLVASVEDLRKDVSHLLAENAGLGRFEENPGYGFRRCLKLPPEIRNFIWDFTLRVPQLHIIGRTKVSRSKVNRVMQACREARSRALELHMDYFQVGIQPNMNPHYTKQYMNWDLDTIWLTEWKNEFLPESVIFHCGICHEESGIQDWCIPKESSSDFEPSHCPHDFELKRLAIHYEHWKDLHEPDHRDGGTNVGSSNLLKTTNARELLLVVGDTITPTDRDIYFIAPR
jgi:hypothetical protein